MESFRKLNLFLAKYGVSHLESKLLDCWSFNLTSETFT